MEAAEHSVCMMGRRGEAEKETTAGPGLAPYWSCDPGQRIGTQSLSFFIWKMGVTTPPSLSVLSEVRVLPSWQF